MTNNLQEYSDELARTYIKNGLPHSMAKVLVYLIVCSPARQTAVEIQQHLTISAGSINTALNALLRGGLIVRSKNPGDKRYFYELDSEAWQRSVLQRLASLDSLMNLAKQGTKLMPGNPRLAAMQDIYQYFGEEFNGIMSRFEQRKKQ